jgi:hypothetical protein
VPPLCTRLDREHEPDRWIETWSGTRETGRASHARSRETWLRGRHGSNRARWVLGRKRDRPSRDHLPRGARLPELAPLPGPLRAREAGVKVAGRRPHRGASEAKRLDAGEPARFSSGAMWRLERARAGHPVGSCPFPTASQIASTSTSRIVGGAQESAGGSVPPAGPPRNKKGGKPTGDDAPSAPRLPRADSRAIADSRGRETVDGSRGREIVDEGTSGSILPRAPSHRVGSRSRYRGTKSESVTEPDSAHRVGASSPKRMTRDGHRVGID